jgi:hypothetical protein
LTADVIVLAWLSGLGCDGARCLTCQRKQGAAMAKLSRFFKKKFGLQ